MLTRVLPCMPQNFEGKLSLISQSTSVIIAPAKSHFIIFLSRGTEIFTDEFARREPDILAFMGVELLGARLGVADELRFVDMLGYVTITLVQLATTGNVGTLPFTVIVVPQYRTESLRLHL